MPGFEKIPGAHRWHAEFGVTDDGMWDRINNLDTLITVEPGTEPRRLVDTGTKTGDASLAKWRAAVGPLYTATISLDRVSARSAMEYQDEAYAWKFAAFQGVSLDDFVRHHYSSLFAIQVEGGQGGLSYGYGIRESGVGLFLVFFFDGDESKNAVDANGHWLLFGSIPRFSGKNVSTYSFFIDPMNNQDSAYRFRIGSHLQRFERVVHAAITISGYEVDLGDSHRDTAVDVSDNTQSDGTSCAVFVAAYFDALAVEAELGTLFKKARWAKADLRGRVQNIINQSGLRGANAARYRTRFAADILGYM